MSDGEPQPGWNVARYLIHRFEQLGIRYLYGVPGNHLGPFLEVLAEERRAGRSELEWVGTPTELGAGYAADGYARIHGVGAAAVTYGVGAFSLLNTIGGAYVEEVPLVAINRLAHLRAVAQPALHRPRHLAHEPALREQPRGLPAGDGGRADDLQRRRWRRGRSTARSPRA